MPKPRKLYNAIISGTREQLTAVGAPTHVTQLTAWGVFPSRRAFARALCATGVSGDVAQTDRYLAQYGGDGQPVNEIDEAYLEMHPDRRPMIENPGRVYISPGTPGRSFIPIPWPPLVVDAPDPV